MIRLYGLVILGVFVFLVSGCGDGKLAKPGDVDKSAGKGIPIIKLTEEILYPGSKPFEGAQYRYVTGDSQAKVAHWFEINLEGSMVEHVKGPQTGNERWYITWNELIIVILPGPEENSSMIQYKKEIK